MGGPLLVVAVVSLVWFLVVVIDMVRRPTWQWRQAGSNKTMWIILEVALFVLFGFLSIVSGLIYWFAARPKLVAAERQGEKASGSGAPWGGGRYEPPGGYLPPGGSYGSGTYGSGTYEEGYGTAPPAYPGTQAPPTAGPPPAQENTPPSWQPDPSGRHQYRYWDGTSWTEHVSDSGQQSTDPLTQS